MRDAQVAALAGRQFNRISHAQLAELGLSEKAIVHRLATGRLVRMEDGVFAIAPVLDFDNWGKWMGATLTAPGTVLSHVSAATAWGIWSLARTLERTLLDLGRVVSARALARALREALRLRRTTVVALGDCLGRHYRRRGSRPLGSALARYSGLPVERARSGAEVRAMEILRDAGRPLPKLNVRIAGEEADLSWPKHGLIVEVDGTPFHLDRGEDARKEVAWESAGWRVHRRQSEDVYARPHLLLDLAPRVNVPE